MHQSYLNVRHLIQVEQVEKVEGLLGFVVLGEAGCVDDCSYTVNYLPKGSLE